MSLNRLARWRAGAVSLQSPLLARALVVYYSPIFAELWYAARDAGERLRARAVAHLYAHRAHPGGRYPDPREPAAFSAEAILTTAARLEGLTLMTYPLSSEEDDEVAATEVGANDAPPQRIPLAWLATYPPAQTGHAGHASHASVGSPNAPQLWLHPPTTHFPQGRILFEAACLLGYVTRERRLLDPDAPHSITMQPEEPGLVALMHQFDFALLHLEPICPQEWGCHCAIIRHRFTAPPADHDQPTETLTLADLAQRTHTTERLRE